MATSKEKTVKETVENTAAETAAETVEESRGKYVRIRLPLTRDQKEDMYVGLNGVGYLIKRGQEVDVPAGVAEIIQRSEEMLAQALEYEDSVSKASHPGEV